MTPSQMIPVLVAEQRALARRVGKLEEVLLPIAETDAKTVPNKDIDIHALIKELQDEYTRYPSFSKSLRAEHARERKREQTHLRSRRARSVRAPAKRKGRGNRRQIDRALAK